MTINELVERFSSQMKNLIETDNINNYPLSEIEREDETFFTQYPHENRIEWCKYRFILEAFLDENPEMNDWEKWQMLNNAAERALLRIFPWGHDMTKISQLPHTQTFVFEGYART